MSALNIIFYIFNIYKFQVCLHVKISNFIKKIVCNFL